MARIGERDEIDAYVGARIGLRRSALGLSQSALAQQLGVSFQQVQKYETGQNRISASRLVLCPPCFATVTAGTNACLRPTGQKHIRVQG